MAFGLISIAMCEEPQLSTTAVPLGEDEGKSEESDHARIMSGDPSDEIREQLSYLKRIRKQGWVHKLDRGVSSYLDSMISILERPSNLEEVATLRYKFVRAVWGTYDSEIRCSREMKQFWWKLSHTLREDDRERILIPKTIKTSEELESHALMRRYFGYSACTIGLLRRGAEMNNSYYAAIISRSEEDALEQIKCPPRLDDDVPADYLLNDQIKAQVNWRQQIWAYVLEEMRTCVLPPRDYACVSEEIEKITQTMYPELPLTPETVIKVMRFAIGDNLILDPAYMILIWDNIVSAMVEPLQPILRPLIQQAAQSQPKGISDTSPIERCVAEAVREIRLQPACFTSYLDSLGVDHEASLCAAVHHVWEYEEAQWKRDGNEGPHDMCSLSQYCRLHVKRKKESVGAGEERRVRDYYCDDSLQNEVIDITGTGKYQSRHDFHRISKMLLQDQANEQGKESRSQRGDEINDAEGISRTAACENENSSGRKEEETLLAEQVAGRMSEVLCRRSRLMEKKRKFQSSETTNLSGGGGLNDDGLYLILENDDLDRLQHKNLIELRYGPILLREHREYEHRLAEFIERRLRSYARYDEWNRDEWTHRPDNADEYVSSKRLIAAYFEKYSVRKDSTQGPSIYEKIVVGDRILRDFDEKEEHKIFTQKRAPPAPVDDFMPHSDIVQSLDQKIGAYLSAETDENMTALKKKLRSIRQSGDGIGGLTLEAFFSRCLAVLLKPDQQAQDLDHAMRKLLLAQFKAGMAPCLRTAFAMELEYEMKKTRHAFAAEHNASHENMQLIDVDTLIAVAKRVEAHQMFTHTGRFCYASQLYGSIRKTREYSAATGYFPKRVIFTFGPQVFVLYEDLLHLDGHGDRFDLNLFDANKRRYDCRHQFSRQNVQSLCSQFYTCLVHEIVDPPSPISIPVRIYSTKDTADSEETISLLALDEEGLSKMAGPVFLLFSHFSFVC